MTSRNFWVFANKPAGEHSDTDWDMNQILATQQYYHATGEPNRKKVMQGDLAIMRIYGQSYIGTFEVGAWTDDPDAVTKHGVACGSFEMLEVNRWRRSLPQGLVIRDLSSGDIRSRIVKVTRDDAQLIKVAQRTYERLGFGGADGEIVVLEKGIEEAIKPNLPQLGLRLADDDIQQQFSMGPGVGRSDLICVDDEENLVVVELKRGLSSDEVIGQVLRYMGYVLENIASDGQEVRGVIVAGDYDEQLRLAAAAAGIRLFLVRLG